MRRAVQALMALALLFAFLPTIAVADDIKARGNGDVINVFGEQGLRTTRQKSRPEDDPSAKPVALVAVFPSRANIGACGAALALDPAACAPPPPPPAAPAPAPALTAGRVLQAFQRIPLPHLRSVTQPDERTLVNFDTIFYVDADPFQRTLTLLGRRVTLAITPSTFTWHHGDGTTSVTGEPGAPYPSKDVIYRYQKAHRTVAHSVTIVWTARYRVGNGPWQDVPGSVSTTGPTTDLRIAEATPVLTSQR
jgi:hypothetical protein